jgi:hypothetical protein
MGHKFGARPPGEVTGPGHVMDAQTQRPDLSLEGSNQISDGQLMISYDVMI